jgi:hypothetical protein
VSPSSLATGVALGVAAIYLLGAAVMLVWSWRQVRRVFGSTAGLVAVLVENAAAWPVSWPATWAMLRDGDLGRLEREAIVEEFDLE